MCVSVADNMINAIRVFEIKRYQEMEIGEVKKSKKIVIDPGSAFHLCLVWDLGTTPIQTTMLTRLRVDYLYLYNFSSREKSLKSFF